MNALTKPLAARRSPLQAVRSDLTFADLIVLAGDNKHLLSDLKVAAAMLGLPPGAVPCDVVWLNQNLFRKSAADFGKTKYRFQNILSSVRKAMGLAGLHQPRVCGERGMAPGWVAVLDAVTYEPQRAGLRRFIQDCASRGLRRDEVTDVTLRAFLEEEGRTRLTRHSARYGPALARAWNRAIASSPDLADCHPLQPPRQRVPYVYPARFYGAEFQAEYAAFKERLSPSRGKSLFKGRAAVRRARDATVKARLFAVLQAAAALVHRGHDPAVITFRYIVENADDVLGFYEERALNRLPPEEQEGAEVVGGQLAVIADTLAILGRHVVGLTGEHLEQLLEMRKLTHPRRGRRRGLTGKVRERLLRLIQPYERSRLLVLAEDIEAAARESGALDQRTARRVRDAIAIEVLLGCPLRMRNLAGLRLDRHLPRLCPGGRWITHIRIEETAMKGHAELEWPVPASTARLLDAWIRIWRPLLTGEDAANPYLFPGEKLGEPMSVNGLAEGIKRLIRQEIGLQVHPHLLRHFAAWRHLRRHPGQYEIVRRALGHASVETTIACYCGLEGESAARLFHQALEEDRAEARRLVRARRAGKARPGQR